MNKLTKLPAPPHLFQISLARRRSQVERVQDNRSDRNRSKFNRYENNEGIRNLKLMDVPQVFFCNLKCEMIISGGDERNRRERPVKVKPFNNVPVIRSPLFWMEKWCLSEEFSH